MQADSNNNTGATGDNQTHRPFISDDDFGDVGTVREAGTASNETVGAPFQVTLLTATKPARLAKRIELDSEDKPKKLPGGDMVEGHAEIRRFAGLADFAAFLETLKPNQALTHGLPAQGDGPIVPRKARKEPPKGKQFRTKEGFVWPDGAGVFMVDYDAPDGAAPLTKEELFDCICEAMPALRDVQVMWRPSGSSCVFRKSDDSQVYGVNGQRLYFVVDDARRIPDMGEALFARLWLSGHGYIDVSKSGSALKRAPADNLVWQTNRLDFAGGAEMGGGLYQDRGGCILLGGDKPALSTSDVEKLSAQERADYEGLAAKAKTQAAPAIKAAKLAYKSEHAPREAERRGIDVKQAEYLIEAVLNGAPLDGGWLLKLENGDEKTVNEILKEVEKYNGMYCQDPIVPRPDQPQVAWLKLLKTKPEIFNHKADTWYPLQTAKVLLRIVSGQEVELATGVSRAMREHGDFYMQGGRVCTISHDGRAVELKGEALLHEIETICQFEGYRQDHGKPVATPKGCPEKIGIRLRDLAGAGLVDLPELMGIAKNPLLTSDGVLIENEGYHAGTGVLLVNPTDTPWKPIPRHPSDTEIVEAFNTLWRPFHLFPYADVNARSVALAAALTAVVRPSLDIAPGFMFSAPSAGTGKSFLAEAVGYITGGFSLAKPSQSTDEFDKLITALLLQGRSCYILDNANGTFGTGNFDALLTSGKSQNRILNKSETVTAIRSLWLITGNNCTIRSDTNRRVLSCYLDAHTERVLDRKFTFDPREAVKGQRQPIVRAALMLISGWMASPQYKTMGATSGDFNQWRRMVAGCVGWLDQVLQAHGDQTIKNADGKIPRFTDPSPMLQEQLLEHDDERNLWGDVLEAWADLAGETKGSTTLAAKELWALIASDLENPTPTAPTERLAAAIGACFDRVRAPRQLGQLLAQKINTPVNGLKLVRAGTVGGGGGKAAVRYNVVSTLQVDDANFSGADD